jgi:methylase of polypeptide subunit release factors
MDNYNPLEIFQIDLGGYKISTSGQLDGYGYKHINDILDCFRDLIKDDTLSGKVFANGMEWCSGPGYIGFMMMKYGMIHNCVFTDIHEPLSGVVNKSISDNILLLKTRKVEFIHSDNFNNIPKRKFDIIFGNPPHFSFSDDWKPENQEEFDLYDEDRKHLDKDWKIHRDFFSNVSEYLEEDGCILLMENIKGSNLDTFNNMVTENNLRVTQAFPSKEWPEDIWYMKVQHA